MSPITADVLMSNIIIGVRQVSSKCVYTNDVRTVFTSMVKRVHNL